MQKIAIEEHFFLPELDDYFRGLLPEVSSEFFDHVPPQLWDLDAGRLGDMNQQGIGHSILSCFNYGSVQLDPDSVRAVEMARRMNDLLAERIEERADRFSGFVALPLQDVAASVAEFRRCVVELGSGERW